MDIVSDWDTFLLPNIIKYKLCKSTLQAILIEHAKWESIKWPEPTQYRI